MNIKGHIEKLIASIEKNQQDDLLRTREINLLKNLVTTAVKYVDIVVNQGMTLQSQRNDLIALEEIDTKRSRIHDSLISQISVVNRLCEKYGVATIYEGPDDRRSKGDFALQLVQSYFEDRI